MDMIMDMMEVSVSVQENLTGVCLEENGVTVHVKHGHSTPEKAKPFFNPRMKTCRELVLATVGVLQDAASSPICCLDAFGASGVAGLQWKDKFGKSCHVTITEKDETCVQSIMGNCMSNGFMPKPLLLDFTRAPGLPLVAQGEKEVFIKQCDVNVMMHMEAFDFIHLDPFGCPVKFLTSAFSNIRNNGVLCIVATDLGSLFAKHSNVAQRNYAAHIVKTEYVQEIGARILIGAAVRSAAQCNKGLEVLYTVNRDHFVIVCVRVKRGAVVADGSIRQVREVIHCQICGEQATQPRPQHLTENMYDLLACSCHRDTPGKTAVLIGPLWCGGLFNVTFILAMFKVAVAEKLSKAILTLLSTLVLEAACPDSVSLQTALSKQVDNILKGSRPEKFRFDSAAVDHDDNPDKEISNTQAANKQSYNDDGVFYKSINSSVKHRDSYFGNHSDCQQFGSCHPGDGSHGNDAKIHGNVSAPKRAKLSEDSHPEEGRTTQQSRPFPMFYYDLHKQKLPGLNLPRTVQVISLLQTSGFRASRTHFCSTAVRTDANLAQMKELLRKNLAS